jgi:hypothetical protein
VVTWIIRLPSQNRTRLVQSLLSGQACTCCSKGCVSAQQPPTCCCWHPSRPRAAFSCLYVMSVICVQQVAVAHAAPPEAGEENSPLPVNSAKRSMSERGRSSNAAAALNLKAWFESQSTKVAADIGVAAGGSVLSLSEIAIAIAGSALKLCSWGDCTQVVQIQGVRSATDPYLLSGQRIPLLNPLDDASTTPAGYHLVHLVPRSASLQQAGGLHRMTLRGHTATVPKVVISPNGSDVITVSDDGTAQVGHTPWRTQGATLQLRGRPVCDCHPVLTHTSASAPLTFHQHSQGCTCYSSREFAASQRGHCMVSAVGNCCLPCKQQEYLGLWLQVWDMNVGDCVMQVGRGGGRGGGAKGACLR